MSNKNAQLSKQAVDSVAEEYWSKYYEDSGYGKIWVREIPKRVKAELEKREVVATLQLRRQAGLPEDPTIVPLATTRDANSVHLEGLAVYGSGAGKKVRAFVVDFDHDGNVHGFDVVDVQ